MSREEVLMEKLLDLTITVDESSELNQRLSDSRDLKREFEFRKDLNRIDQILEVHSLRMKLRNAQHNVEQESVTYKGVQIGRNAKRVMYAAATVAGIALGGWGTFSLLGSDPTAEQIFRSHFEPYPPVSLFRDSHDQVKQQILNRAMSSYQLGNYNEALASFEEYLRIDPESITAKFYLGVTYLELDQFQLSTLLLQDVAISESIYAEQALWYYALGHLAQNNIQDALAAFQELSSTKTTLGEVAKELIGKINDL